MPFISTGLKLINTITANLLQLISAGLGFLFGSINYQAPSWLKWLGSKLCNLRTLIAQKPIKSLGIFALLAALIAGGWQAWLWYQARPQPVTVKVTVTAPTRTEIEYNAAPNPLSISFDSSVAPIELVDKTVTEGISLLPKIDGVWKWTAENTLQFQPKAEWPVGTQFKVSLNAKALTPKTLLDKWDIEFNAPLFIAGIVNSEFYQDPINAAMKK